MLSNPGIRNLTPHTHLIRNFNLVLDRHDIGQLSMSCGQLPQRNEERLFLSFAEVVLR